MKRKLLGAGFLGHAVAAAVAGVVLLTGAAVTPAQAYGTCSASLRAALWYSPNFSVRLNRTPYCTYYALLVIDHPTYGAGQQVNIKVERQENGQVTSRRYASTWWGPGTYSTSSVQGWWAGATSQDQHRACWTFNWGAWTCTHWVDV